MIGIWKNWNCNSWEKSVKYQFDWENKCALRKYAWPWLVSALKASCGSFNPEDDAPLTIKLNPSVQLIYFLLTFSSHVATGMKNCKDLPENIHQSITNVNLKTNGIAKYAKKISSSNPAPNWPMFHFNKHVSNDQWGDQLLSWWCIVAGCSQLCDATSNGMRCLYSPYYLL